MHAADALMSPTVALGGGILSVALVAISSKKVKETRTNEIIPLMGVMGAFVFAAQMINFTIPGTGSSGHLIGGVLLSALLGPWCAFITLTSIIVVQCLVFADGGLFALGCNIINMAAISCLIAYPLVFKPFISKNINRIKLILGSVISSVVALEIGAFAVTLETEISGITALPFSSFIKFMLPIHFIIGLAEGIVTAALLIFIYNYKPDLINPEKEGSTNSKKGRVVFYTLGIITLVFAFGFTVLASEYPDGLEWSIERVAGMTEFGSETPDTAILPDYNSSFAGIIGAIIVMLILWGFSSLLFARLRKSVNRDITKE